MPHLAPRAVSGALASPVRLTLPSGGAIEPAEAPTSRPGSGGRSDRGDIPSTLSLGGGRFAFGADLVFAAVHDQAQHAAMGRERQMKPAYAILSALGEVNPHISYRIEMNAVQDSLVPRPYSPHPDDRRTYFFPNQPEGRGVTSDPSGLYKVDFYKHPGLDPIIQQGFLRVAYVDIQDARRRYGLRVGRFYVPRGLGLEDAVWFTGRDLTHIQAIDTVADNGASVYYNAGRARLELTGISGNGNPYHDYGYFDFTDPTEEKNAGIGLLVNGRLRFGRVELGGTYQENSLNSRIEDAISTQLSKHNDGALLLFGSARPAGFLRVFGQYARYEWGLAASSAALHPEPIPETPVIKDGYFWGADVFGPDTPIGRWGLTFTNEVLSRDDSLVAYAAARGLFGVTMGRQERSQIVKAHGRFGGPPDGLLLLQLAGQPVPGAVRDPTDRRPGSDVSCSPEQARARDPFSGRIRRRAFPDARGVPAS